VKGNAGGFTLIEVLVAIAVMAIALTGIAAMGVSTIEADINSRHLNTATALAQAKLEELRIVRRTNLAWAEGTHRENGLYEDGSVGGGPYDRQWIVDQDYGNFTNLYRVTITVSWEGGQVSLSSLYW
jgi:prepilin-type N-terminal cleavage/methylation domain-containing protein